MTGEQIQAAVEQFAQALQHHAEAMCDAEVPAAAAMTAINDIRAAARHYIGAVFETTGWGNVFADLEENDGDEDDHDDEEKGHDAGDADVDGSTTLTICARYDYAVPDIDALIQAGQQARNEVSAGDDNDAADPVRHVGEAIYEIIHAAGPPLSALSIPALRVGSGLLTVHRTNSPLQPDDFRASDDPLDLMLPDEDAELVYVLTEPMYETKAEAERAAERNTGLSTAQRADPTQPRS